MFTMISPVLHPSASPSLCNVTHFLTFPGVWWRFLDLLTDAAWPTKFLHQFLFVFLIYNIRSVLSSNCYSSVISLWYDFFLKTFLGDFSNFPIIFCRIDQLGAFKPRPAVSILETLLEEEICDLTRGLIRNVFEEFANIHLTSIIISEFLTELIEETIIPILPQIVGLLVRQRSTTLMWMYHVTSFLLTICYWPSSTLKKYFCHIILYFQNNSQRKFILFVGDFKKTSKEKCSFVFDYVHLKVPHN